MKKILKYGAIVTTLFISISVLMFALKVCPPQGPWPTPPWCRDAFPRAAYDVEISPQHLPQIKAVNMFDTWGRNYNMGMFETTQANIASSFARVKELGAGEVYVHDFHRAVYEGEESFSNPNYTITDETFWNDFRDETISEKDLKKLVDEAHRNGLKLGIKHNMSMVNIGKYLVSGISGSIQDAVAKDTQALNNAVDEAWVRNFFNKWESRLVARARVYNTAGVDIMSVSPAFMTASLAGHEALANELYKKLIADVRKEFKGQISAEINIYGLMDGNLEKENWELYDYYDDADIQEVRVYTLPERFRTGNSYSPATLRQEMQSFVDALDKKASEKGIRVSLFFAPSSYKNSIYKGPVEIYDVRNTLVQSLAVDFDEQAQSFDAVFQALTRTTHIARVNVGNFAWDDALDPAVTPRISITATFRNKPAEEVVRGWFTKE